MGQLKKITNILLGIRMYSTYSKFNIIKTAALNIGNCILNTVWKISDKFYGIGM